MVAASHFALIVLFGVSHSKQVGAGVVGVYFKIGPGVNKVFGVQTNS